MITPAEAQYYAALDPIPANWGGMGAVRLVPDARDYRAVWHPEVREVLLAGGGGAVDWSDKVCSIENQGSEGSCVPHSTCSGIQLNENINQQVCYRFNAPQLYRELGGSGANGVDSRQTLERCKSVGAPLVNSNGRVRVGSYFWIDQNPATFATQVKAALVAGKSVVIALLLPSTFGGKWQPGNPTQGYHQIPAVGTDGDDRFWGPNSWSESWPGPGGPHPAGFYEMSFQYCTQSQMQNNYCYAYFFDTVAFDTPPPPPIQVTVTGYNPNPVPSGGNFSISGSNFDKGGVAMSWQGISLPLMGMNPDVIATKAPVVASTQSGPVHVTVGNGAADGPPLTVQADSTPPPPVDKTATVKGQAKGASVGSLLPGQSYTLIPGATLTLTEVTQDSGPTPPPGQLTVSGYSGYTAPLLPTQPFVINGTGFAAGGNLIVTWGTAQLTANRVSDTEIRAIAPSGAAGSNAVTVRIEALTATGPVLTIGDGGPPPPVGDIKVMLTAKPSQLRNTVSIICYTADASGASFPASVNGTVTGTNGVTQLNPQTTHGTQSPVIWSVPRPSPWGTPCQIVVNAFSGGKTGTASTTG